MRLFLYSLVCACVERLFAFFICLYPPLVLSLFVLVHCCPSIFPSVCAHEHFTLYFPGEHLTEAELAEYMSTLMGQGDLGGSAETGTFDASGASELLREHLSENFTAESFAAHVIGFSLEATS